MEKKWNILNVRRTITENVVTEIVYDCVVSDGTFEFNQKGKIIIERNVNSPEFISYTDLTESIMLSWVDNYLGDRKKIIEDILINQIITKQEKMSARTHISGLPWKE